MQFCITDVHVGFVTMRICVPKLKASEMSGPVEFSNMLLLLLGAGAALINPLFDKIAPILADLFKRRRPRAEEVPEACG